ncbi:CesD/SycD/LcrH family type III secretion system chaperone [Pandoraea communis]|uniref:CesD/SycD/LcrH family type III secretion system chaperone n=2 Tax=Pandoraea communis TaxID=2508297 RepID=A0A5E4RLE0_9BURK|nr:CesD/SycD/LcrH family type III secretion system chaperone [Pandoraea communis]
MSPFEIPQSKMPSSQDIADEIDVALAAVRDAEKQREAMGMPRPGAWDAMQCDTAYRCGYGAFERGDYAQAIECFAPLLSACPLDADYAVALALSVQRHGEPRAALPLFMAAALMDEEAPGPMYRVGECLIELQHFEAAYRAMKETLHRCAGQPKYVNVGNAARRMMARVSYLN